ncbi:ABC transporter ATP-binding protein [Pelagibaculum spongiae]|uniref:ABC transporter ATP-binding protein n=1 Tax=Pelagibaculum spongiae TaxID=2080658 RepID=A0A2V1GQR3_9GAMM|nr:ABC transporter ATP-binding protein [Pelagibaculum spongiae]
MSLAGATLAERKSAYLRENKLLLELDNISCNFGQQPVVKDLSFNLDQAHQACLLGASGCGKTTVLRAIAGFQPICQGEIRLDGMSISRANYSLPVEQRGIGMVFQDYALFPHLTVAQNIAFGLKNRTPSQQQNMIAEMLELVGLEDTRNRFPHELSGGQQQRVATARALAPEPRLLLLDEPFSNLDASLRERLVGDLSEILKQRETAALLVTHDQQEAFALADQIAVLQAGELLQMASPQTLYQQPAQVAVAEFVGQGSWLEGVLTNVGTIKTSLGELSGVICPDQQQLCFDSPEALKQYSGQSAKILIRPEQLQLDDQSRYQAKLIRKVYQGGNYLLTLELVGKNLLCKTPWQTSTNLELQKMVGIKINNTQ